MRSQIVVALALCGCSAGTLYAQKTGSELEGVPRGPGQLTLFALEANQRFESQQDRSGMELPGCRTGPDAKRAEATLHQKLSLACPHQP